MALIPLGEKEAEREVYVPEEKKTGIDIIEKFIEKWRDGIFTILVIAFITAIFIPDIFLGDIGINLKLIIFVIIIFLIIRISVVRLLEYERAVVFRLGKFHRVAGPGWELIFPIVEKFVRTDLRLKVYTIEPQEIVTKDKVRFLVSPEIFMYVSNPKDAVINVDNYEKAVLSYVNSALTHVGGDSTSDYIVAHMDDISEMLEHSIEKISTLPGREWGVIVPKIKLGFIRFPDEVQSAMHKRVAAGQLKLAAHEKADATKIEIDAIREAGSKLTDPAITYLYLEALDKIAKGKATKMILPLEISKIAESITKRTGALPETPEVTLPKDLIRKYKESVDRYDKKLKEIEDKLAKREIKERKEKSEKKETEEELNEYKERIREIKKRIGI